MPIRFNLKTNIPNTLFIKSDRCSTWANLDTSKWSLQVLSNSQEFNIIKGKKPLLEVIIVKIKYIVKKIYTVKKTPTNSSLSVIQGLLLYSTQTVLSLERAWDYNASLHLGLLKIDILYQQEIQYKPNRPLKAHVRATIMATLADVHKVATCAYIHLRSAPATVSVHPTLELLHMCEFVSIHTGTLLLQWSKLHLHLYNLCKSLMTSVAYVRTQGFTRFDLSPG